MKLSFKIFWLGILFILLKLAYRESEFNHLFLFLKPVAVFVKLAVNADYQLIEGEGYYFETLHIIINKSCSGFNFFIISLLSFMYLVFTRFKIKNIILALLAAYILCLLANISRTISLILIQVQLNVEGDIVHEGIGAFIFISLLLAGYIGMNYLIKSQKS